MTYLITKRQYSPRGLRLQHNHFAIFLGQTLLLIANLSCFNVWLFTHRRDSSDAMRCYRQGLCCNTACCTESVLITVRHGTVMSLIPSTDKLVRAHKPMLTVKQRRRRGLLPIMSRFTRRENVGYRKPFCNVEQSWHVELQTLPTQTGKKRVYPQIAAVLLDVVQ